MKVEKQPNGQWRAAIGNPATDLEYHVSYSRDKQSAILDVERKVKEARGQLVIVDIRKATQQPGYLLSVTRTYPNGKGGQVYPGPRCSNLKTAREVAAWIETHLPELKGESV